MKATVVDLRYKKKEVLTALDRGEGDYPLSRQSQAHDNSCWRHDNHRCRGAPFFQHDEQEKNRGGKTDGRAERFSIQ